ncbi:YqeG family HAD IIIA-type phosphatase [Candidatus Allofournierella merdipullorum]|uniref:YqeG family HAD IIIA-type phosphatase n=1 Tax=Candidatus Allofournierella merdipullorum TaxID=2838595 RepID=UPI002A8537F7|nr:YqeG family HAD IIIA-type phosphatase [Candidatus Fournierella merdipullorum]
MLITPEYLFSSVSSITTAFLKEKGIAALVLDVDDTLTAHGSQQLDEEVERWLETMRAAGVKLMIVSNNTKKRVSPFAARLGLPFVSMACKPLTFGLAAARRRFGVKRRQMAIVGDQLFTDRLAASFFGIRALVVSPRGGPARKDIQFKRKLEQPFLRRYYQKGGKLL